MLDNVEILSSLFWTTLRYSPRCSLQCLDTLLAVLDNPEILSLLFWTDLNTLLTVLDKLRYSPRCAGQRYDVLFAVLDNVEILSSNVCESVEILSLLFWMNSA